MRLRSKKWKKIREKALKRDGYKCRKCGKTPTKHYGSRSPAYLVVHHLDGNQDNNDMKNLMTLCTYCHPTGNDVKGYHQYNDFKEWLAKSPGDYEEGIAFCQRQLEREKWRFWGGLGRSRGGNPVWKDDLD